MFERLRPTCLLTIPALAALAAPAGAQLADPEITDVVDRELLLDRAVVSHRVDVATDDGAVTLTGTVDNLMAKRRAERIAETVKGVRSVRNRIDVRPSEAISAEQLQEDVEQALFRDPVTESFEISTSATADGHVRLDGTVDSWQEKRLATRVAGRVQGVTGLTNQIEVNAALIRPDREIELEIEKSLRWNTLVDHSLVEVGVQDGAVSLSGTVGSAAEKREAAETAWTAGVTSVDDNGLEVERWARDEDLREGKYGTTTPGDVDTAIETALRIAPRVDAEDVEVVVSGSTATLRGTVQDLKAKRRAERTALETVGVGHVNNYLKVRPTVRRGDEAIESDVRDALALDPFVERYEILVDVRGGDTHLYGEVDSFYEKAHADDIAARVDGVVQVSNELDVQDEPYAYDPFVDLVPVYELDWYAYTPSYTIQSDASLEENIEDELFWSPFVDSDEVDVEVEDGIATLEGTVDSWMETGVARDNAFEAGATYVRNRLEVEAESEVSASGGGATGTR